METMHKGKPLIARLTAAAPAFALVLAGLLAPAPPAAARMDPGAPLLAQNDPFSALVGERRERKARRESLSSVDRYVISADGRAFLLQTRGQRARIKFLCSDDDPRLDCRVDPEGPAEEIVSLTAHRGARGDVLYKDRDGETLLMLAAYGGATVFWPGETHGEPASKSFGDDPALRLPEADRSAAWRRARFATAHLSALTGGPVVFDIGRRDDETRAMAASALSAETLPATTQSAPQADRAAAAADDEPRDRREASVLADAVARAAGGMQRVADDPTGARYLGARVREVRFVEAPAPSLALEGGVLVVGYDPEGGLSGRPSSAAIARFLEESL